MQKNRPADKPTKRETIESEELFRSFSDQSFVGHYLIQDEKFVYVNPKFADIFGFTVDECLDEMHFKEFVHPDDLAFIEEQVQRRTAGEIIFLEHEFRGIKKNGKMIHVKVYGSSILYKGRIAASGSILDITESKNNQEINQTLFDISNAVNTTPKLKDLYRSIHGSLSNVMDLTNFFIAIVDVKEHTMHFPYHVDTADDDYSPITDFDPNKSLTGLVASMRKPVLLNRKQLEKRAEENGVWGELPQIWMGVPLIIKKEVIGVIAAQSYVDPNLYKKQDLKILSKVSDQIAIAIDHKRTEDALHENEKKYRRLFKNAPAGIYEVDFKKNRFIDVNELMCDYSGYSKKEFLSLDPLDLFSQDSRKVYRERLENLSMKKNPARNLEYKIINKMGEKLDVVLKNDFVYKKGKLIGALVVVHDITDRKLAEKKLKLLNSRLEYEATHDPLTGGLNRRAILDILAKELIRTKRRNSRLSIGLCDVDHFKQVNDTYGHQAGDDVLRSLVKTIQNTLRPYDLVGRYGGEEFLLVIFDSAGLPEEGFYERIREKIAHHKMPIKSGAIHITVSIGITSGAGDATVDEMIAKADTALYKAKKNGRNQLAFS
ncbi:MAG: diguanylate cyclase [Desulfobacula sp.]|jgi:diguanylate cyclase (GGDEF)-like protein/PAS domain S-box-containing protein|uniref:diguanylate cyclase n=3 Tax=Desulfobacula sp. TaxID=2593537 RepID=UPI001E1286AC|nr:diguanylate cyclase [Desulfobacula sp.]MBT3483643.1 diguanylate cyclase [Desulfobacula sp.]MBT3804924.1 diguanylate cyclase [Desulfobacula sp.]MBT4023374.1 diguanylate cyclase [Desulfobacula sp.]MBT4197360.1 diguanylate cyclase [Desulfobacula sp.]